MSKTKNPYTNFNAFCLRTPLFSLDEYLNLCKNRIIKPSEILQLYKNPILKEAIYLTSPELYKEFKKWEIGELSANKTNRLANSLLKYYSRITSRCTPFGLFAGCSAGKFKDITNINLVALKDHQRHTRLDMDYLVNLTNALSNNKEIRKKLKWFSNSSLYKVGEHYRQIEYTYQNKSRNYSLEAITASEYIEKALESSKLGKTITELAETIVEDKITIEEAIDFIEELIDNQILVSEIEPPIAGKNYLPRLISFLQRISVPKHYILKLTQLQLSLKKADKLIGNPIGIYEQILQVIDQIGVEYNPKYLIQTDLFLSTEKNELSNDVVIQLKQAMNLLNKLTFPKKDSALKKFKEAFSARYEDREVFLVQALDVEMGIGYLQNHNSTEGDPLLDDLILPEKPNKQQTNKPWNTVTELLHNKLSSIKRGQTLELLDPDFKDLKTNWKDLPDTFSTMIELYKTKEKQQIFVDSFRGSSAGNLLGRFSHGDKELYKLSEEIIAKEKELEPNAIHAEIIHLPESRTGNILHRVVSRDYEIPYLGASKATFDKQLPITDLMLSIKNNELYLRSKKHNKKVIPHLTNAHNYSYNPLPIYHFLCDLQAQVERKSIYFDWGVLAQLNEYLPRVVYKNLILSKAKWFFKKEVFNDFYTLLGDDKRLSERLSFWKKKHQLPQFIQLVEGDNTLLINLENITTFHMLLQSIKNKTNIILEEFLFTENTVVKNETGNFTNQIVIAFYKDNL